MKKKLEDDEAIDEDADDEETRTRNHQEQDNNERRESRESRERRDRQYKARRLSCRRKPRAREPCTGARGLTAGAAARPPTATPVGVKPQTKKQQKKRAG